ncbi:MAG: hypothetical protein WC712_05815 [Candidatus Brocadiia bacterium]
MVSRFALAFFLACCFFAGQVDLVSGEDKPLEQRPEYVFHRFLGLSYGRYWFIMEERSSKTLRVWAYNAANRKDGRILEHKESLADLGCTKWVANGLRVIAGCDNGNTWTVELAQAEVRRGPDVDSWFALGRGNMIAARSVDCIDVLRLDGTRALTRECNLDNTRFYWVSPTSIGLQDKTTKQLTVVDCNSGESLLYRGVEDVMPGYEDIVALQYTNDEHGKALKAMMKNRACAVFKGALMNPAPYDLGDLGFGPHYGIRTKSAPDGQLATDFLSPADEPLYRFWHGGRGIDWNIVNIAVVVDDILRVDLLTGSLCFYDRKSGLDASGRPFANLLCHSLERESEHLLMLFADGRVLDDHTGDRTYEARVPMGKTGASQFHMLRERLRDSLNLLYVWNGESFFRCGYYGGISQSEVAPLPGSVVVMSSADPVTLIGTSRWTVKNPQANRAWDFSLFENDRLFDADPQSILSFQISSNMEEMSRKRFIFWGNAGVLEVDGKKFSYRKPEVAVAEISREAHVHKLIGDVALYSHITWEGGVTDGRRWGDPAPRAHTRLFDFIRDKMIYETDENLYNCFLGANGVSAWIFRSNPEVLFFLGAAGRTLYAVQSRWIGAPPLFACFPVFPGTCSLIYGWRGGIQCLDCLGNEVGFIALPEDILTYSLRHTNPARQAP